MVKGKDRSRGDAESGSRAEKTGRGKSAQLRIAGSEVDAQKLLQELRTHQVELEMQNEELRQTRDDLEKALQSYTELYDFAPVGYLSIDRDGTVRKVNLTGAGLLGMERSRLIGRSFRVFVKAENRELFDTFLHNIFDKEMEDSCEISLLGEDHEPRQVRVQAALCQLGSSCHIVVMDITPRYHALKAQQLSDEKLRLIFNSVLDGIHIIDMKGHFLEVNDAFCRRLGYSRRELLEVTPEFINAPVFKGHVKEKIGQIIKKGSQIFESAHVTKNGLVIPVEVNGRLITFQGQQVILSIVRDITDRKVAEETLINERAFTEKALNSIKDIFFVIGLEEKLIRWNESLGAVTGYTDAEITSMLLTDFFTEDQGFRVRDAVERVYQTGHAVVEAILILKDGRGIPYEFTGSILTDHAGRVLGISGTGRDITERKIAEQGLLEAKNHLEERVKERTADLVDANRRLQKSMDSKTLLETQLINAKKLEAIGQLAAGVAHEVRNPLNAILSITEALFREPDIEANPEYEPYIHHIRVQVGRLSQLMKDLLELGRPIPASSLYPVPLRQVVNDTVTLLTSSGVLKNNRLTVAYHPGTFEPRVLVDGVKLQQVLFNVIENATQHSPEGSEVALSLIDDASLFPPESMAVVRITDRGKGIAQNRVDRVFDPFFTGRRGGTGLGLTLVRHFVEHMGGSIKLFNNSPPPGCTVEIRLPLVRKGEP